MAGKSKASPDFTVTKSNFPFGAKPICAEVEAKMGGSIEARILIQPQECIPMGSKAHE
eukprot:CAMPEP_0178909502 /NCGR_PEP_ID=MMETSP0786-20121207/8557_1 /TAXON_ID=186022 /ORGANISM="Thalassionema frauenfeldii, Strain CCMP 1798" /LENGTH=57 /DNA_ID=CAMNT_0020581609 /DNA_START=616 /DNA_END=789 /DNA_ORIENTATION=+